MAFASNHHIVIAIIAHLAGASGMSCSDGAGNGQCVALAFLSPKRTAHPPHFNADILHLKTQSIGNLMLYFAGVLRRAVDDHFLIILRQGQCGLAFKVKMFLSPYHNLTLDFMRGPRDSRARITFLVDAGTILKTAIGGEGLLYRQDRLMFLIGDLCQARGFTRAQVAGRNHQKNRLAAIMNAALA